MTRPTDALQSLRSARLAALAGQQAASKWCKNLEGDFSAILMHLDAALASLSASAAPSSSESKERPSFDDITKAIAAAEFPSDKLGEAEESLRRLANAFDPVEGPPDRRDWTTIRSAIYRVLQERAFAASATQRSDEAAVLDAMCIASGYKRWWINSGKLFFERDGDPGYIQVLLVEKAAPADSRKA